MNRMRSSRFDARTATRIFAPTRENPEPERRLTPIEWHLQGGIDDALARARREAKPLFVDFWSPGCRGCAWMDAVSYTDPEVAALLAGHFVCVKYDTRRGDPDLLRLSGPNALLWTPTLVVLDPSLSEVRRLVGYLPPRELDAELAVGLALVALRRRELDRAIELLRSVADRVPPPSAAPEALYWAGVAAYYQDGRSLASLSDWWREIGARHPRSAWRERANVLQPPPVEAPVPATTATAA
jgi:hypothetical protein